MEIRAGLWARQGEASLLYVFPPNRIVNCPIVRAYQLGLFWFGHRIIMSDRQVRVRGFCYELALRVGQLFGEHEEAIGLPQRGRRP